MNRLLAASPWNIYKEAGRGGGLLCHGDLKSDSWLSMGRKGVLGGLILSGREMGYKIAFHSLQ